MSLFTIVACGSTAKDWIPRGHSIGCNDAFKFGKPLDSLLVCNRPAEFTPERFQTIISTKPKNFYSHKGDWVKWFPYWKKISKVGWYGTLYREQVYTSSTSPFIALSLAFHLGATEIIMWGCDFKDHRVYSEGKPETEREVQTYLQLIRMMGEQGCKVWLGAEGTAFDGKVPVYTALQEALAEFANDPLFIKIKEGYNSDLDDPQPRRTYQTHIDLKATVDLDGNPVIDLPPLDIKEYSKIIAEALRIETERRKNENK